MLIHIDTSKIKYYPSDNDEPLSFWLGLPKKREKKKWYFLWGLELGDHFVGEMFL